MAIITITTPFNIDLEFKVATLPKRVFAWFIDVMVISMYFYLMMTFIYPLLHVGAGIGTLVSMFIVTIPVMLYQLAFELMFNGQTLGKQATGIKVIDIEGKEPAWSQYAIRWILCLGNLSIYAMPKYLVESPWFIIAFMFIYIPDVIVLLISRKSQRIGDLAAGTVVIDSRYRSDIRETIYQEIEVASYTPLFPQVMRLTDRDINGIRNLLDVNRKTRESEQYVAQVVSKIKTVLNINTYLEGYDFLQQLLYDYNFISGKD